LASPRKDLSFRGVKEEQRETSPNFNHLIVKIEVRL
jgi:hypothetical protein